VQCAHRRCAAAKAKNAGSVQLPLRQAAPRFMRELDFSR
jgi:hypothetical protein